MVWDSTGLADGTYELAIQTSCLPAPSETKILDGSLSSVVSLSIDKAAPRALQLSSSPATTYFPGDEISMSFTENVDCSSVKVSIRIGKTVLDNSKLAVSCLDNKAFIELSPVVQVFFAHFEVSRTRDANACSFYSLMHWLDQLLR